MHGGQAYGGRTVQVGAEQQDQAADRGVRAWVEAWPIFSVFSTIYRNDYGKPLIYSRPPLESSM